MSQRLFLYLLTCFPLMVAAGAWIKLYRSHVLTTLRAVALVSLSIFTINALLAAITFVYYELRPPAPGPPWQDPQILTLGLLGLSAPFGMFVGFFAAGRGTPKWLFLTVEIASLLLVWVGFMAGLAV